MAARRRAARIERARETAGVLGVAVARLRTPQHEEAWTQGARGERVTARRLERRLAGRGVVLLHDRRIPGSRANIDHLAVGPGGVTVVDAKAISGRIRTDRAGELVVAGRSRAKLVDGILRQIAAVEAAVGASVDVRGCLCVVDPEGLPLLGTVRSRGVPVYGARGAARLCARPGGLDEARVDALVRALAEALPSAA